MAGAEAHHRVAADLEGDVGVEGGGGEGDVVDEVALGDRVDVGAGDVGFDGEGGAEGLCLFFDDAVEGGGGLDLRVGFLAGVELGGLLWGGSCLGEWLVGRRVDFFARFGTVALDLVAVQAPVAPVRDVVLLQVPAVVWQRDDPLGRVKWVVVSDPVHVEAAVVD